MTPAAFARVPLGTFEEHALSPEVPADFRGIRIAAPVEVVLDRGERLPLCGTWQVDARFFNRFRSMDNEIVVVAVDAARHAPYAANLLEPDFTPAPAHFDESEPGWEETVLTGWFNLDLFEWLEGLPRRPGRYHVFATVGDAASNVVTVEIRQP